MGVSPTCWIVLGASLVSITVSTPRMPECYAEVATSTRIGIGSRIGCVLPMVFMHLLLEVWVVLAGLMCRTNLAEQLNMILSWSSVISQRFQI